VVLHGIRRAGLTLGRGAVICGAGPIGLIALLSSRASGAHPLVITDLEPKRLEFAKKLVPECETYQVQRDLSSEDNAKRIRKLFGDSEYGCPETVLECTGVESSIVTGAFAVRRGGTLMVIGVGRPVINNIPFMHLSLAEVSNFYHFTLPSLNTECHFADNKNHLDRYQIHQQIHRYLACRHRSCKRKAHGSGAVGFARVPTGKGGGSHAHLC
jgi:threonine dehydrogenase-like Zn-dependent dehydrogenase